jgi:Ca-activated chloride channel family protein
MKFVCKLLAALLLWLFIACNDSERGSAGTEKAAADSGATADMIMTTPETADAPAAVPAPTVNMNKCALPKIVKDAEVETLEESKIGEKHEEKPFNTEDYDRIVENRFLAATQNPLSTFSIDVDEAAYSNVRRYINNGSIPPAGAVRIEEMINYFDYNYPQPTSEEPFSVNTELSECPWNAQHRLLHIGLQGKEIPLQNLPNANIVFLIDVSGSMDEPNKLPLVKASMNLLADQLRADDKVAIVVYAGNAGLVLPATSGANKIAIKEAIDQLQAGGSTDVWQRR